MFINKYLLPLETMYNERKNNKMVTCDCGKVMLKKNLARHMISKNHTTSSTDKEDQQQQNLIYLKEKITCDCGVIVSRAHISRHKQGKHHLGFVKV